MSIARFNRQVYILSAGMFCMAASYTMLVPFLPVYLMQLGVEKQAVPEWSGIIFSAAFLVGAVMAPIWGRMSDMMGQKKMCLRAAICISVSYFAAGIVSDPWQLLGTRILLGFSNGFMPAAMALIAFMAPKEKIASSLGIFLTGQLLGHICGPVFGGIIASLFGVRTSFVIGSLLIACAALLVFFFIDDAKPEIIDTSGSLAADFSIVAHTPILREMLTYSFLIQFVLIMLQPVFAIHIGHLCGSVEGATLTTGIVLGLGSTAGALTAAFWGHQGQQRGYFRTMFATLFFSGIFMTAQAFSSTVILFALFQFCVGLFFIGTMPSLNAVMSNTCPQDFRGRIFGMNAMVQQIGGVFGPLFSGFFAPLLSTSGLFMVSGMTLIGMAGFLRRRHISRGEN